MNVYGRLPRPPKRIRWRGSSRKDLRAFPDEARHEAGEQLFLMEQGYAPDDWRPIPLVGPGSIEIRVHSGGEHRVIVVAKFEEAIYVLHAFSKKTQATSHHDIELAERRYRELVAARVTQ